MTKKLSDAQLAERDLVDTLRTVVRLKHRIAMRHELNELEADALAAQAAALEAGKPYQLDVASVFVSDEDRKGRRR